MRGQARRGSSLSLVVVLAATLVAASLLGLAASWVSLAVLGEGGGPLRAEGEDDVPSGRAEAPQVSLEETLRTSLSERMPLAGEDVVTSYQRTPLPEAAKDVLARYEAQGDCLLCEAGYLDLQGNVWGCVVQGDGWVEVQVVKSVDGGTGSELSVVHMDAQSWAQQLEGLGEEGS